jgi:hypothetical protein
MQVVVLKGSSLTNIKYQFLALRLYLTVGQLSAITKEVNGNPFLGIQTFLYSDTKILLYGKTWSIAARRYSNGKRRGPDA